MFGRKNKRVKGMKSAPRRKPRSLSIEGLESRELMAADFKASYFVDRRDIGGVGETALVADFNGDKRADIGVYIPNGGKDARWVIKYNQGDGTFREGARYNIDRRDIGGVGEIPLVGDFNGDGKADIGVYIPNGNKDARWVIKFNQGDGTFRDGARYNIDRRDIGGVGETPLVGDFNGDGLADIGVYVPNGNKDARWVVKFNQGNGKFREGARYDIDRRDIGGVGEQALVGDFNGDGKADIGVYVPNSNKDARWVVKFNQGNGNFRDGARYDVDRRDIGGVGAQALVGDFNGDKRADLGVYVPNGGKDARWAVKLGQEVADPPLTRTPAYVNVVNGVLQVVGDGGENRAQVYRSGTKIVVTMTSSAANGFSLVPFTIRKEFESAGIREIRFWGYEGDDSFQNFTDLPCGYVDGGAGNDEVYLVRAGSKVYGAEKLQIAVPGGQPQGSSNTCGPNSAWRVMQAYGGLASMQTLISSSYRSSVISSWNLGTTGQTLTEVMNSNRRGLGNKTFTMSTGKNVNDVINHLRDGKPVLALIGHQESKRAVEGTVGQIIDGIFGSGRNRVPTSPPTLHWIAVTGYDLSKKLIYFTDTDGKAYTHTIDDFNSLLRWRFDDASQRAVQAAGVTPGTIIV